MQSETHWINILSAHKRQSAAITCLYCAGQQMPHPCYSATRRCSCCPSQPQSSTVGYPVVFPNPMDYGVLYLSSLEKKRKKQEKKGDGQKLFCFGALSIRSSSPHYDGAEAPLPGSFLALRLTQDISDECSNNLNPMGRVLKWKLASAFSIMTSSPACGFLPWCIPANPLTHIPFPTSVSLSQANQNYSRSTQRENDFLLRWVIGI